jgi:UDP-2-acetamido-2-deoxy-ribo-hexuluronate aminotransferase
MNIDYEDIEDSQVIASAIAINAQVVTRDKGMLDKYPDIAITPQQLLNKIEQQEQQTPCIDFANLKKQYFGLQPQIEKQMDEVLNTTSFIMGDKVRELEKELQKFTGAKHAITCSNGTDALLLAMMAIGIEPDDEVITTPFTFIATAETIALMKAKPVFVDIEEDTYNIDATKIEAAITEKTKAIMPVSLYGQPADIDAIQAIADKHNLKVIIDGAQSFGSTYKGKTDSNLGDISTTSFFPAKPLGCYGDGGAVFTNNDEYADKMRMMRVHGQNKRYRHKYIGMGGRLDTLQAAILLAKLPHYQKEITMRQSVADSYTKVFKQSYHTPIVREERASIWAQYTICVNNRNQLQQKLKEVGIPTSVHYPKPLHLQACFKFLGLIEGSFPVAEKISKKVISLPMNPFLSGEEIKFIIRSVHVNI